MYRPSQKEIDVATSTSRSRGAIGSDPIAYRVLKALCQPGDGKSILDFGAGKEARHSQALASLGYAVSAYDLPENSQTSYHLDSIDDKIFDLVIASNVLNTQSSVAMLQWTLTQIEWALKPGGLLIANYPQEPRKAALKPKQILHQLKWAFGPQASVVCVGKASVLSQIVGKNVVFLLTK